MKCGTLSRIKNKFRIWKAYCRDTRQLIGRECRGRDNATFAKLYERLKRWNVKVFFSNNWRAHSGLIPPELLVQTKTQTHLIESSKGIGALLHDGRKGGNNRKMSKEEAQAFLSRFDRKAQGGQTVTAEEIALAYGKVTQKKRKSRSSVYYFLHSHGRRMVMPRGQHKSGRGRNFSLKKINGSYKELTGISSNLEKQIAGYIGALALKAFLTLSPFGRKWRKAPVCPVGTNRQGSACSAFKARLV